MTRASIILAVGCCGSKLSHPKIAKMTSQSLGPTGSSLQWWLCHVMSCYVSQESTQVATSTRPISKSRGHDMRLCTLPALAIERRPPRLCFSLKFSSANFSPQPDARRCGGLCVGIPGILRRKQEYIQMPRGRLVSNRFKQ